MTDTRKDLPPTGSANFLEKVREALSTYLGGRGDRLDRGLTVRDLYETGIIDLQQGFLKGGGGYSPVKGPGASVAPAVVVKDLTPPPTPTGFMVSAGISQIFIGHDAPLYTPGQGHNRTIVYGVTYTTGALPVFANAVKLTEFPGSVFAYPTNPATTWRLWIKWLSNDGVLSLIPAGGTNGLVATTGQDVSTLLTALNGQLTASQLNTALGARINLIDGSDSLAGSVNTRLAAGASVAANATALEAASRNAAIVAEALSRANAISAESDARTVAVAAEQDARVNAVTLESIARSAQAQDAAYAALTTVLATNAVGVSSLASVNVARVELTQNLQAGLSSEAALRVTLGARLDTADASTLAAVSTEAVTRSTADTAEAANRLVLAAKLDTDIGSTLAAVTAEQTARSTAIAAEAASRLTLAAKLDTDIGTTLAAVGTETTARSTAVAAESTQRGILAAQFRGTYTGTDPAMLTEGLLYQEGLTRASANLALSQQITLLSAGAGEQFDWQTIWYFDSGIESWTGNGTPTSSAGWLRPANQASGAYAASPAGIAADGSKYGQVRLRIRKTGTPTFAGFVWWRTASDSTWDTARRIALTVPTYDSNGIGLITASPAWPVTVDQIRVDLSSAQTATDYFEMDWVAIGRPSPGASSAQLLVEQTARSSADLANVNSITTLSSQVNNTTTGLPAAHSLIAAEQTARSTADTAEAALRTTLAARVTTTEGAIVTNAAAITTEQTTRASADSANAGSISALSAQVNNATTGLPAAYAGLAAEQTARANADTAEAALRTTLAARVTTNEGNIATNASAISAEQTTRASADSTNASNTTALSSQVNDAATGLPKTRADLIVAQNTFASGTTSFATDVRTLKSQSAQMSEAALKTILNGEAANAANKNSLALASQELRTNIVDGLSAEATARLALLAVVNANAATLTSEQLTRASADDAESAARVVLTARVTTNEGAITTNTANITSEQNARATADSALSTRVDAVVATATTDRTNTSAAITSEATSRAAADTAEASARTTLAARVTTSEVGITNNSATIANESTARATADTAISSRVDAVVATAGANTAAITSESTARATADTANASSISALSAQVNNVTTGLPQTRADLITEYTTRATADTALGTRVDTVVATATTDRGAATAAVQTEATARANADGTLFAQYTVKVDVNGYVAGFGLASTAINGTPTSAFAVRADQFYIASPSGPGVAAQLPFIVRTTATTINGVSVPVGVYMQDAFIQNGTITNAKIGNAQIDDAKIANLSASKITSGYITVGQNISSVNYYPGAAGWTINGSGYAEFSNVVVRGGVYASYGSFTGNINADSGYFKGSVNTGSYTGYAWPAGGGGGAHLSSSGLLVGNANTGKYFQLTAAGDLYSPGLNIIGGAATFTGSLNVRSAASGARMEVTNDVIKVFDSGGNLRVQIGNLNI